VNRPTSSTQSTGVLEEVVLAKRLQGVADRIAMTPVQIEDANTVRQAAEVVLTAPALLKQGAEEAERRIAELEAINEGGFDEVIELREQQKAMTEARDLCKRQTAEANRRHEQTKERLEKTREVWQHEKERADQALAKKAEEERERLKEFVDRALANADWHAKRDEGEDAAMWRNYASALLAALDNQEGRR
jgi:hypothetical protein